jgi:hypothetical protein
VYCKLGSVYGATCLKNYYNNAQDIEMNSNGIRKPLWTLEGRGARRNQGWSQTRIEKFDTYCRLIAANQVKETSKKIEKEYRKRNN